MEVASKDIDPNPKEEEEEEDDGADAPIAGLTPGTVSDESMVVG